MLTYQQLEVIASILGWDVHEVESSLETLNNEFMKPDVQPFSQDEALELCQEGCDADPSDDLAGYYCRLSAPGYLDCTDWSGPYATEEEAVANMLSMWGE
jgi:hypothetical protein